MNKNPLHFLDDTKNDLRNVPPLGLFYLFYGLNQRTNEDKNKRLYVLVNGVIINLTPIVNITSNYDNNNPINGNDNNSINDNDRSLPSGA